MIHIDTPAAHARPALPDYLPARMLNEFVYCPRLFYYEWVESQFAHNVETVEGAIRHARIDQAEDDLPPPTELVEDGAACQARSIELASDTYRIVAKMDLVEARDGLVTPVDYKRGRPREAADGTLEAWDPDRVQLAAQALVLRENGYNCREGVIYYGATKQRVRVAMDDALLAFAQRSIEQAFATAAGSIPPPLEDSPKCPRCSLVTICLPDETRFCRSEGEPARDGDSAVRRLMPARDDLRPLYLNTQGLTVGKSSLVLRVKERDKVVQEVRIQELCQVNLFGGIQITTQAIQALCEQEVPIAYFSQGGWFYGMTHGLGVRNVELRLRQFHQAANPATCLRVARALIAGKIRNQRTLLQRNHVEPPANALALMKQFAADAERAESLESLLGIEGNGARIYFEHLSGMIKVNSAGEELTGGGATGGGATGGAPAKRPASTDTMPFDFTNRNRRPPRDPVNAMLSLAYSLLAKDLTIVCHAVGFDPYLGFLHQPRFGRAALAVDLMEPFRPLIADSAVLTAINTRMVTPGDFVRAGDAVNLTAAGRRSFFRAYEQRMDALVTHPLFGYRVSYRRLLEVQARLLARFVAGEMSDYPVFVTR